MRYKNTDAVPILDGKPDVVEVVRCKDCKYAKPLLSGLFMCEFHTVHTITKSSIFNVKPYDFCSYGERREK